MGWLKKIVDICFPPQMLVREDPTFIELKWSIGDRIWWSGTSMPLGDEETLLVGLVAGQEGPKDEHTAMYEALDARWEELRAAMTPHLFHEVSRWFDRNREAPGAPPDAATICPHLSDPEGAWRHLVMTSVEIDPDPSEPDYLFVMELLYGDGSEDTEHALHVAVRNWEVEFCGIEG